MSSFLSCRVISKLKAWPCWSLWSEAAQLNFSFKPDSVVKHFSKHMSSCHHIYINPSVIKCLGCVLCKKKSIKKKRKEWEQVKGLDRRRIDDEWRLLCLTGVTTAGRANSAMSACFTQDVCMGPATSPGSATVRGTGVVCCVIKVWIFFFLLLLSFLLVL